MRTALFSDAEREMVKHFLKTGEKGKDFRVLVFRARHSKIRISDDFDLLSKFLAKLDDQEGEK